MGSERWGRLWAVEWSPQGQTIPRSPTTLYLAYYTLSSMSGAVLRRSVPTGRLRGPNYKWGTQYIAFYPVHVDNLPFIGTNNLCFIQAKIAFLQGERKGHENLMHDLVRRIKMLEYALKQERWVWSLSLPLCWNRKLLECVFVATAN